MQEAAAGLSFVPFVFGREGGETVAAGLGSAAYGRTGYRTAVGKAKRAGKRSRSMRGTGFWGCGCCDRVEPDLLIHMTHATKKQLRECAEIGIPIAVCRGQTGRSVLHLRHNPPVVVMEELGCTVCLGTDNAMFVARTFFQKCHLSRLCTGSNRELCSGRQCGALRFRFGIFISGQDRVQTCSSSIRPGQLCASRAIRSQRW